MSQPIPVVVFDEITGPIARGDFDNVAKMLADPRYLDPEFICGWIAFDIFEMPETTLSFLLGLLPSEYLIACLDAQHDFHVRVLLSMIDKFRPQALHSILARGFVFTQAHIDQLVVYGTAIDSWRLKEIIRNLYTSFPNLKLEKLAALAGK